METQASAEGAVVPPKGFWDTEHKEAVTPGTGAQARSHLHVTPGLKGLPPPQRKSNGGRGL